MNEEQEARFMMWTLLVLVIAVLVGFAWLIWTLFA